MKPLDLQEWQSLGAFSVKKYILIKNIKLFLNNISFLVQGYVKRIDYKTHIPETSKCEMKKYEKQKRYDLIF